MHGSHKNMSKLVDDIDGMFAFFTGPTLQQRPKKLLGDFRAFPQKKSHSHTSQRVMQKITQRSRQLSKL